MGETCRCLKLSDKTIIYCSPQQRRSIGYFGIIANLLVRGINDSVKDI